MPGIDAAAALARQAFYYETTPDCVNWSGGVAGRREGKQKTGTSSPLPMHFLVVGYRRLVKPAAANGDRLSYGKTENEILKSQLKGRLRLRDDDRRRLAMKGKALGRKLLAGVACIVTPETIVA